jgi:hypothetical protein
MTVEMISELIIKMEKAGLACWGKGYRQEPGGWRIIQTHWLYTDVFKNKMNPDV